MVKEQYETNRLILRKFKNKDVIRIYNSWNNPKNYRYNEIPKGITDVSNIVNFSWPNNGLYFFVIELKSTHEAIGTCRIGKWYFAKDNEKIWDFGYNIFRSDDKSEYSIEDIKNAFNSDIISKDEKYWGKGYATELLKELIAIAKSESIDELKGDCSILNYGSAKVMINCGMTFDKFDLAKCSAYFSLNLNQNMSAEETSNNWKSYIEDNKKLVKTNSQLIKDNSKKHYEKATNIFNNKV